MKRISSLFRNVTRGHMPGDCIDRRTVAYDVSERTLRRWRAAGLIEQRGGADVLTAAGYRAS